MIKKTSEIIILLVCFLLLIAACKGEKEEIVSKTHEGLSGTINIPLSLTTETQSRSGETDINTEPGKNDKMQSPQLSSPSEYEYDFYDSKEKVDPFLSLILEQKTKLAPSDQEKPARVLSPLEKIDFEQLRLTAIVIMKDKRIAMVEEPSGKGYEIKIGTYIGKNQGRVSRIDERSIWVSEPIKVYNGDIKERIIEKKLYKYEHDE